MNLDHNTFRSGSCDGHVMETPGWPAFIPWYGAQTAGFQRLIRPAAYVMVM